MKVIRFDCSIRKFRGLRRFVASKEELLQKLEKVTDDPIVFDLIKKHSENAFGTYDIRVYINTLINTLYQSKRWLETNSMDEYEFVDNPIHDLNIYFKEMETIELKK